MLEHWLGNVDTQIIVDIFAALEYMLKYAIIPEKTSRTFTAIFHSVMRNVRETTDPLKKLPSLMVQSIQDCDVGLSETTRLLLGGNLWRCNLRFVHQKMDFSSQAFDMNEENGEITRSFDLLSVFADLERYDRDFPDLNLIGIPNLFELVKRVKVVEKTKLVRTNDPDNVVVMFHPHF
jgi:hypothetical protein